MAFGLFVLVVAPFILTVPAHAADNNNTISLSTRPLVEFEKDYGDVNYIGNNPILVTTNNLYGFNLTMQADNSDLTNSANPAYKISSTPNTTPSQLKDNQWGYQWGSKVKRYYNNYYYYYEYAKIPNRSDASTAISIPAAYEKRGNEVYYCNGTNRVRRAVKLAYYDNELHKYKYQLDMRFAAKIDLSKIAAGKYSTNITYTVTMNPEPKIPVVDLPTVCKSGDSQNDCQVDLDANMIPVKYTGNTTHAEWTSLAKPEDDAHQGEWYNYNDRRWANALTVKKKALAKYKGQTKVVDQADILGFWVYIPRYAYEVMRRDGTDRPVLQQNFLIRFEKTTTPKRHPAVCPEKGKDYRTECGLNRDYIKGKPSNVGTWATHPAFTFGTKELNGIWFGKFTTTLSRRFIINGEPTPVIRPNNVTPYYIRERLAELQVIYLAAKSLGVGDPKNLGGYHGSFARPQNSHRLIKFSSRMVNNNDWGAVAYLASSEYGAGYNKVQRNGAEYKYKDGGDKLAIIPGCGPSAGGKQEDYYSDGDESTCSLRNPQRNYNGTIGQLASTTNNPTGIYDMFSVSREYVAAGYSNDLNRLNVNGPHISGLAIHPPYANTYNFGGFRDCTYQTCGGQALYETLGWENDMNDFVRASTPWFTRYDLFSTRIGSGMSKRDGPGYYRVTFRVTLGDFRQD